MRSHVFKNDKAYLAVSRVKMRTMVCSLAQGAQELAPNPIAEKSLAIPGVRIFRIIGICFDFLDDKPCRKIARFRAEATQDQIASPRFRKTFHTREADGGTQGIGQHPL